MEDKFSRYVRKLLEENQEAFLAGIPLTRVRREHAQWQMRSRDRYVCVVVKDNNTNNRTYTTVGVGSNLKDILLENAKKPHASNGATVELKTNNTDTNQSKRQNDNTTTQGTTHCKLVMYMTVPPYTNFTATELRDRCVEKGYRWQSRCRGALLLAKTHGLRCSVSEDVLNEKSSLYVPAIAQFVQHKNERPLSKILSPQPIETKRKKHKNNVKI